jgi:4-amino-4-deoxy-L-arabinose transferase-like glycosyltransferase
MMRARLYWLALIAILLLGAGLRLGEPGLVEFKRDEANLSQLALDLVRGKSFPLLGIVSSVGIPNSPVSVYLLALPYALTSSPVVATQFIGLLNLIALLLVAVLVRRYYGDAASLLATLLYAVSPWAIIYSRKIWAQDMLPPFVIGTLFLSLLVLTERKRWAGWLCLPLLAITVQIHYSGVLLVIPVVLLVGLHRRGTPRSFWWGAIPAALLCLPFIAGLLQADLLNPARIQDILNSRPAEAAQATSGILTAAALQYAALIISGTDIHSLTGPQVFRDYLASLPDLYPLFSLMSAALVGTVVWLIIRSLCHRDQRRSVDVALLALLLTPIAAFSVTWTTVYPHYFILLMPGAFIGIAVGVVDLWRSLAHRQAVQRWCVVGITLIVFAILGGQLLYTARLNETLATRYTPDGFGVPLGRLVTIRQAILDRQPDQLIAQVGGMNVGVDDLPSVWNFLLADVTLVRFVDDRTTLLFISGQAAFLTASCELGSQGDQFALREPAEGCYTVSEFARQLAIYLPTAPLLSNGVRIHAAAWDADQGCVALVWSVSQPTSVDYFFKVHLMDSAGARVGVADGPAWSGRFWQAGDVLQSQYCVPTDTDHSAIEGAQLGMYTYDGVTFGNVEVLDALGKPAGQSIDVVFE